MGIPVLQNFAGLSVGAFTGFDQPYFLSRPFGQGLVGAVDSQAVMVSFWIWIGDTTKKIYVLTGDTNNGVNNFPFSISFENGAHPTKPSIYRVKFAFKRWFDNVQDIQGYGLIPVTQNAWHHVCMEWNLQLDYTGFHLNVDGNVYSHGNGVFLTIFPAANTSSTDVTHPHWYVGAGAGVSGGGTAKITELANFALADVFLARGYYSFRPDPWVFFRDNNGQPRYLGETGAAVTGSQPLIWLHLDAGQSFGQAYQDTFTNRGSGGNFKVDRFSQYGPYPFEDFDPHIIASSTSPSDL